VSSLVRFRCFIAFLLENKINKILNPSKNIIKIYSIKKKHIVNNLQLRIVLCVFRPARLYVKCYRAVLWISPSASSRDYLEQPTAHDPPKDRRSDCSYTIVAHIIIPITIPLNIPHEADNKKLFGINVLFEIFYCHSYFALLSTWRRNDDCETW
jgi:hypothetical protein